MIRRRGFTLIELLVVIAIIGILAAMLFPVFARARESARKTQCLANVKNLAIAVNMYLTDYDKFWPSDHNPEAEAYFSTEPGKGGGGDHPNCNRKPQANPFLRAAVILDDYTKNRDIYHCGAAKVWNGPGWIVPDYNGSYLNYLKANPGLWGREQSKPCAGGPCCVAWPTGWGGSVTDSLAQRLTADQGTGAPDMTVGFTMLEDVATSRIQDPVNLVVCGDIARPSTPYILGTDSIVWDLCRIGDCGDGADGGCCAADWENCSDTQQCGLDFDMRNKWNTDPSYRSQHARHLGGSNVGFADGHAKWWPAEALLAATPDCDADGNVIHKDRPLRGVCPVGTD